MSELTALSDDVLIDRYCVVVDHRSFPTEVVNDFAAVLDEGDVLAASGDELPGNFSISINGEQYYVPLQSEPGDTYVTLCSLAVILSDKYEFRLLRETQEDDTHIFLLLPFTVWEQLDRDDEDWSARFIPLELGLDAFSGKRVPYVGEPEPVPKPRPKPSHRSAPKRSWWKLW